MVGINPDSKIRNIKKPRICAKDGDGHLSRAGVINHDIDIS